MPRTARLAPAGTVFHVLNRGVGRRRLFDDDADYAAFERCLAHALAAVPGVALLAYCLMPNHWHLLVVPAADDALGRFMQRLTVTHARRWQARRGAEGEGHLYQGRFKSFPAQDDDHFLAVARYVERNPVRAGLVADGRRWPWSSLGRRPGGHPGPAGRPPLPAAPWPVQAPADWAAFVNAPQTDAEVAALRRSVAKGRPFGTDEWVAEAVARLGLGSSERSAGRPQKVRA